MIGWGKAITSRADRAYCRGCMFTAPVMLREDYLCEHLLMTGKPRGCKAGVGCTARRFEKAPPVRMRRNVCEKCGKDYEAEKRSRLCPSCRMVMRQKAALHMVEVRKKKSPKTVQASQGEEIN